MRAQNRTHKIAQRQSRDGVPLLCPECSRTFVISPDFVMDLVATGRVRPNRQRAELRCRICGHTWWSKHAEALRKGRAVLRLRVTQNERRA